MNTLKKNLHAAHQLTEHYRQRKDTAHLKMMKEIYYVIYDTGNEYRQADSIVQALLADALLRKDARAIRQNYYRKHRIHAQKTADGLRPLLLGPMLGIL